MASINISFKSDMQLLWDKANFIPPNHQTKSREPLYQQTANGCAYTTIRYILQKVQIALFGSLETQYSDEYHTESCCLKKAQFGVH
ncbi:MAG: hypothetical protein ACE5PV_19150, partial [Candidatus Poribacteria bacterium]